MRLAALLVLAACASSSESARSVDNVGEICVSGAPGAPLVVHYAGPCLSGSCTKDQVASCVVVQLDSTTIRVSAHGEWLDFTKEYGACTRDCADFSTTCSSAQGVAAGTYTLVFGDSTMQLTLPLSAPTCMRRY